MPYNKLELGVVCWYFIEWDMQKNTGLSLTVTKSHATVLREHAKNAPTLKSKHSNNILALRFFTNHWIIYSTRPTNIFSFNKTCNWMVTKLLKCLRNLLRCVIQKVQVATKSGFTAFSSAFPAGNLSFCSVKAISGSDLSACIGE